MLLLEHFDSCSPLPVDLSVEDGPEMEEYLRWFVGSSALVKGSVLAPKSQPDNKCAGDYGVRPLSNSPRIINTFLRSFVLPALFDEMATLGSRGSGNGASSGYWQCSRSKVQFDLSLFLAYFTQCCNIKTANP